MANHGVEKCETSTQDLGACKNSLGVNDNQEEKSPYIFEENVKMNVIVQPKLLFVRK